MEMIPEYFVAFDLSLEYIRTCKQGISTLVGRYAEHFHPSRPKNVLQVGQKSRTALRALNGENKMQVLAQKNI